MSGQKAHPAEGGVSAALLGVTRSATGRAWRLRSRAVTADAIRRIAARLESEFSFEAAHAEALARILTGREVTEVGLEDFLRPTLKALFPDPYSFRDMDRLVAAILDAVSEKRAITIFADYDVDGATSAALLARWLKAMGASPQLYVPDRLTEGYGPSPVAFDRLKAEGAELIITVDCGASAHSAVDYATLIGLQVAVIDHHLMRSAPPQCLAVVNPNRPDCPSGQGNLCAAGVVFVALAALNREARARGMAGSAGLPDLMSWLDLAALGAICDVTRLTGFNRALTAQGLKVMSRLENPGIRALSQVAGGNQNDGAALLSSFHSGFVIGPRINAGGRVGRSDLGARLLMTEDAEEARQLALELDDLNRLRRDVEAEVTEQARALIIARFKGREDLIETRQAIVVAHPDWHPGVIGIVAGRLREIWRKPVIVIALDPVSGIGKGSGRSQPGVNLGAAIGAAFDAGILLAGGGHAMAAGLTIDSRQIVAFEAFLENSLVEHTPEGVTDDLDVDLVLSVSGCTRGLLDSLDHLAPFGPGNTEPVIALGEVRLGYHAVMKGGHVRAEIVDQSGQRLKAVAWRAHDTAIGMVIARAEGLVSVTGRLKRDDYMGRNGVQIEIEDIFDCREVVDRQKK